MTIEELRAAKQREAAATGAVEAMRNKVATRQEQDAVFDEQRAARSAYQRSVLTFLAEL